MTKTEIKRAINKAVYEYVTLLGYTIYDDGDGSTVTFAKESSNSDNSIDYSRSSHETCILNWASNEIKNDAKLIEEYAAEQIRKYGV